MQEAIGWFSSAILVITIGQQVYKQWHDQTSKGVSRWLFVGQMLASAGFTLYSLLLHNWVFVVTNGIMLCAAMVGFVIKERHRARSTVSGGVVSPRPAQRDRSVRATCRGEEVS